MYEYLGAGHEEVGGMKRWGYEEVGGHEEGGGGGMKRGAGH